MGEINKEVLITHASRQAGKDGRRDRERDTAQKGETRDGDRLPLVPADISY